MQGREESLAAYARIVTAHYAIDEIRGKAAELATAFLKSVKAETSERETILALKGTDSAMNPSETCELTS